MSYRECSDRTYQNTGNQALLDLVARIPPSRVLDCGCGAGDNARALAARGWEVTGITISAAEQSKASEFCRRVCIYDLEDGIPPELSGPFRLVILSHVLEHLRNPGPVLRDVRKILSPNGYAAVALPNVLNWRQRAEFLLGRFEYRDSGIMDNTHLRFYTFETGRRLLEGNGLRVTESKVEGSFPLRYIRQILPGFARSVDRLASEALPGLFGYQLLYLARPADGCQ